MKRRNFKSRKDLRSSRGRDWDKEEEMVNAMKKEVKKNR